MLVGSGGREHALAWKLSKSPLLSELVLAPGSDAMMDLASNDVAILRFADVSAEDIVSLLELARTQNPDLVVVGPEITLAKGLADKLQDLGVLVFGPSAAAAQLEASKAFTKELCEHHHIPAARSKTVNTEAAAHACLEIISGPYVLKADGLAAGKGVVITEDLDEAKHAASEMLSGQFGSASKVLVIEEFLGGEEASLFVLCDGKTAVPMVGAQDHKRAFEGDTGPNTGGMGCYSPAPILDKNMTNRVMKEIVEPTLRAMAVQNQPFCGVLYAGLMIDENGPKLIEYNVRFGDPECQVLMRRLRSDLLPALLACAKGELAELLPLQWDQDPAACVVMASNGYPSTVKNGSRIENLEQRDRSPEVVIFHAGTKKDADGNWLANGGRVLNVTATGKNLQHALDSCYHGVDEINWPEGFYRRDIGWRAL